MNEKTNNKECFLNKNSSSDVDLVYTCEEALNLAGDSNFYQIRTTILLSIQWLLIAFLIQGQLFLFLSPNFLCKNEKNEYYSCSEEEACRISPPYIDDNSPPSLSKEFSLYCTRNYLKSLCQTLFFTGSNVATLLFSFFSDFKGRKSTLFLTYSIGAIALIISRFSLTWYMFMFFLILTGIGLNPYSALCFILLNESAGEKFRQNSSIALLASYGFGQLIFVLIAYMFPDWKELLLYWIAIPLFSQLFTFFWIFESPKFLVSKKEFQNGRDIIMKIAKINKRKVNHFKFMEENIYQKQIKRNIINKTKEIEADENVIKILEETTHCKLRKENKTILSTILNIDNNQKIDHNDLILFHKFPTIEKEMVKIYTYVDLFRNTSQLKFTLILSLVYFSLYLTYYGGVISTAALGGSVYISAVFQTSAELFGYLCINIIIEYLKRRVFLIISLFLQTLTCLLALYFTGHTSILILAMVCRFFVAMSLSIMTVYTAEIYPTTVRSLGIGVNTFIGKFGCALAPIFISWFQYTLHINPMVSFAIAAALAGFCCFFLEETKGKGLKDEIPEFIENKRLDCLK